MKKNTNKKLIKKSLLYAFIASALFTLVLISYFFYTYKQLPDVRLLSENCIYVKKMEQEVCKNKFPYKKISAIPTHVYWAFILAEDASFYSHKGVDFHELKQSLKANWKAKSYKRGASTISQQVIKNIFLSSSKTILRKVKEVILTTRMEKSLRKGQILELYLNIVEFNKNTFGIERAAKYYFKKASFQLSSLEAIYLAALLPNPNKYSKDYKQKKLHTKHKFFIKTINDRMLHYKKITSSEHQLNKNIIEAGFFIN